MSLLKDLAEATATNKHKSQDIKPYMYQTKEDIETWMQRVHIKGMVNREMEIEAAESDTDISHFGMKKENALIDVKGKWVLPVKFRLTGAFDTGYLELDSYVGFPHLVMGKLTANNAKVSSLEGLPALVTGDVRLMFRESHLKNLVGFPTLSGGKNTEVWLGSKGAEETSTIDSLEGISHEIGTLSLGCNFWNIKDIVEHCPKISGLWLMSEVDWSQNPSMLAVFKLRNLKIIFIGPERSKKDAEPNDNTLASDIIKKHLQSEDRSMLDCKEELYAEGLKRYARSA